MADLVWSDPDPEKEDFAISPRGAGYTFGSGVVHKFLETNGMSHILRAHQLCMEGYASLFDKHLSTVWSAPNYCYRCGNSASILEVGPGEAMFFNVFEAAPENERDGPSQQAAQNAGGKVRYLEASGTDHVLTWTRGLVTGIFLVELSVFILLQSEPCMYIRGSADGVDI